MLWTCVQSNQDSTKNDADLYMEKAADTLSKLIHFV